MAVSIIYLVPGILTKTIQTWNKLNIKHSAGSHWLCCCFRIYWLNLLYSWGHGWKQELKLVRLWNCMHINCYMAWLIKDGQCHPILSIFIQLNYQNIRFCLMTSLTPSTLSFWMKSITWKQRWIRIPFLLTLQKLPHL